MIPYTNRPIQWHTDGYYNRPERMVRAMILHCVRNAASGGDNDLLDHEMAYLWLRSRNPEGLRALWGADAMTIPARETDGVVARAAQTGPVFSTLVQTGALHMRYTARTRSIAWRPDPQTQSGVETLASILADPTASGALRVRLEPGMGLLAANVLHTRSAFLDDPERPRLLYRVRYLDAIGASSTFFRRTA
jgi:alpha-ketoglutarate-dependent taurine dioxygenase